MASTAKNIKRFCIFIGQRALCYTLDCLSFLISLFFLSERSAIPSIDDYNLVISAVKLSQQIKIGHVTSEEVVKSFIARIKQVNPIINSVVNERFELALIEAREIDRKIIAARDGTGDKSILELPLVGVPMSVKETISVEGYAFTGGLIGRKNIKAVRNADVIDLLQKEGLIVIGLTNTPELAMWWDSNNPIYGRTLNPYDLSRIPGGSSGGETATIAAGASIIGIGTDVAGSIRIPANFCGVFGHKPTPFVVPTDGIYPMIKGDREKLLGLGPMTRYACDLLPLLKIMAGPNADKLRLNETPDLRKLKIYYIEDIGDPLAKKCNKDILVGIRAAAGHLMKKYMIVAEKITFDEFKYGFLLWAAEASTEPNSPSIAIQIKNGKSGELNPIVEFFKKIFNKSEHNMSTILSVVIEKFTPTYGSPANQILTSKAMELRKKFNELLGDNGILFVPSHPEPAPKHATTIMKLFNVSYTSVTTVLQGPITQCPLGLSKEGLPFGVQIMARPYNDKLTIAVALELEKAFGGWIAPCSIDV